MEISTNIETKPTSLFGKKNNTGKVRETNDSTFKDMLTKNDEKTEIKRTLEELVADIISLLKTGLTVGEVEALQELLLELKDKIKEGNYSEKEIEDMLSKIEKAILSLQKKVSGQAIIEAKDNDLVTSDLKDSENNIISSFLERIEEAMETLEDLSKGKDKNKISGTNSNESELLKMIKEFKK